MQGGIAFTSKYTYLLKKNIGENSIEIKPSASFSKTEMFSRCVLHNKKVEFKNIYEVQENTCLSKFKTLLNDSCPLFFFLKQTSKALICFFSLSPLVFSRQRPDKSQCIVCCHSQGLFFSSTSFSHLYKTANFHFQMIQCDSKSDSGSDTACIS